MLTCILAIKWLSLAKDTCKYFCSVQRYWNCFSWRYMPAWHTGNFFTLLWNNSMYAASVLAYIGWQWRNFFISYLCHLFFHHFLRQALQNVCYCRITSLERQWIGCFKKMSVLSILFEWRNKSSPLYFTQYDGVAPQNEMAFQPQICNATSPYVLDTYTGKLCVQKKHLYWYRRSRSNDRASTVQETIVGRGPVADFSSWCQCCKFPSDTVGWATGKEPGLQVSAPMYLQAFFWGPRLARPNGFKGHSKETCQTRHPFNGLFSRTTSLSRHQKG